MDGAAVAGQPFAARRFLKRAGNLLAGVAEAALD
jgi:hypothetical protein